MDGPRETMKRRENAPEKLHLATASRDLTRRLDLLVRAVRPVTSRTFTTRVLALVDLCATQFSERNPESVFRRKGTPDR